MDKNIGLCTGFLNKIKGGLESVSSVLGVAVVEVKAKMFEMLGIGEVQVDSRADSCYFVFLELLEVMGEVISANPDFT